MNTDMTRNHKLPAPPSEYLAMIRLERGQPETVQIGQSYAAGRVFLPTEADGYAFPWGQVVARQSGMLLVFDFYLADLQLAFERNGLKTVEMQDRAFALLEELSDHTVRDNAADWFMLASQPDGWKIIPATLGKGGAFTILAHVGQEKELRQWLIAEFILEILPQLQERLYGELPG